jgi:hypothetical protein
MPSSPARPAAWLSSSTSEAGLRALIQMIYVPDEQTIGSIGVAPEMLRAARIGVIGSFRG